MAAYTPILATLGYVMSSDGTQVLMIHRNTRPDDLHYGKYNGLGGKLDSDEDVVSGMRREIREEAGIEAEELVLRGTISWPGFGKNEEDWFAFIFASTVGAVRRLRATTRARLSGCRYASYTP